jgi:hypothetical protein
MANNNREGWLKSNVIREMQTAVRYIHIRLAIAKIHKADNTSCW